MQKEQLIAKFQELYGEGGEIRTYFAPGRVNLIGEHTDYNGGHVFPCALTMGTWAVVRNREDRKLGFFSLNFEKLGIIETSLDELIPSKNAGRIEWTALRWKSVSRRLRCRCFASVCVWILLQKAISTP